MSDDEIEVGGMPDECPSPSMKTQGCEAFFFRAHLMSAAVFVLLLLASATICASEIAEPPSVQGLQVQKDGNAVVLSWPSDPGETFAVLWRSNNTVETPWSILDSQLRAAPGTNCTMLRHNSAVTALVSELYRVLVVPDFWFNMQAVVLSGGPKNPGQDFLPFYYGTAETGLFRIRQFWRCAVQL
jgi:hypothetical protein